MLINHETIKCMQAIKWRILAMVTFNLIFCLAQHNYSPAYNFVISITGTEYCKLTCV